MLIQILDSFKRFAWGMVAGSCLVAVVISHRANHSIWVDDLAAPSFPTALQQQAATLHCVSWNEANANETNAAVMESKRRPVYSEDATVEFDATRQDPFLAQYNGCDAETCTVPCHETVDLASRSDSTCETASQPQDIASDFVATGDGPNTAICNAACNKQFSREHGQIAQCGGMEQTLRPSDPSDRKVTMRDSATNQAVATLTITGPIASAPLSKETLELAKAERSRHRPRHLSDNQAGYNQNFVNAFRDEGSGHFTIEAHTVEIAELAQQIAAKFGLPLICHESAVGTVSASVTDVTLERAIRRLVEPFGFAVVEYGPRIVIGDLDALEQAARDEARAHEARYTAERQAAATAAAQRAAMQRSSEQELAQQQAAIAPEMFKRLPPVPINADASPQTVMQRGSKTMTAQQLQAENRLTDGKHPHPVPIHVVRGAQAAMPRPFDKTMKQHAALSPEGGIHPVSHQSAQLMAHLSAPIPAHLTATPNEMTVGREAKALVGQGLINETIDLLTGAVEENPMSAILYRMLAEAYFHRGDLQAAEAAAKRSLDLDRSNPMANQVYGDVLARLGQVNRSEHYLNQAKFLRGKRPM